jgi:nucleoid DNA-binding protein
MNWRSENGKSGLIKMLMREHGISKRKAEKAVNAVFDCMTGALKRGECVEAPGGTIIVDAPSPGQKRRIQKFRNIETGEIFHKLANPPKRVLRFRSDKKLIQRGPFPPPAPPPPSRALKQKQAELEQLLIQLGFPRIDEPDLKSLLAAVDDNRHEPDPHHLDRLLARLRELVKRGQKVRNIYFLCAAVRQLNWIRE